MCETDLEHLLHVFFDCAFASQCWQLMGMHFDMWSVEDAAEWLLNKLETGRYAELIRIAMTLWTIWFFRNKKVWDNKVVTPKFAVDWSLKQLQEWKSAVVSNLQTPQHSAEN